MKKDMIEGRIRLIGPRGAAFDKKEKYDSKKGFPNTYENRIGNTGGKMMYALYALYADHGGGMATYKATHTRIENQEWVEINGKEKAEKERS